MRNDAPSFAPTRRRLLGTAVAAAVAAPLIARAQPAGFDSNGFPLDPAAAPEQVLERRVSGLTTREWQDFFPNRRNGVILVDTRARALHVWNEAGSLYKIYPTSVPLPHLGKSRGQIVAVSSLAGLTGVPLRTGYAATKHAQIGFFDSLRIELRGTGVSVTVIAPYYVQSEIRHRAVGGDGQPLPASPVQEAEVMTAEECARQMVAAMETRQRMRVMTLKGRLGRWVRLIAPELVDRMAERSVRKGR